MRLPIDSLPAHASATLSKVVDGRQYSLLRSPAPFTLDVSFGAEMQLHLPRGPHSERSS